MSEPVALRRRVERSGPLSRTQREVWASQRLHPEAPVANMATVYRIRSEVDPDRFVDSFRRVVAASDSLRSIVASDASGRARIDVLASPPAEADVVDVDRAGFDAWCAARVATPIDVTDCAYDAVLVRHADDDWSWWLDLHHVVTDATAQAVVFAEVAASYADSEHAPSVGSFLDRTESKASDEAAVEVIVPGSNTPLRPLGVRGPETTSSHPVAVPIETDTPSERAREVHPSISSELSLLAVLVSGLAYTMHRLDGRNEMTVGVPVHHRRARTDRRLVGPLMELHPVEVTVDPDDTAASLVERTLGSIVAMLRSSARGEAPSGRFELVVNVFSQGGGEFAGVPVEIDWVRPPHVDPAHVLRIQAFEYTNGVEIDLDVNDALVPAGAPNRLGDHLARAVDALLGDPDARLGALSLATGADLEDLAALTPRDVPETELRPVHEVAVDFLAADGDRVVAEDRDGSFTCARFDERVRRTVAWLRSNGVEHGDRVGVRMQRSVDVLVTIHAILRTGAAFVMLDPADPASRHRDVERDAELRLIVDHLDAVGEHEPDIEVASVSLDDIAYVLYTSGSTGAPKGVPISHRGLGDYLRFARDEYCEPDEPHVVALHSSLVFDLTITSLFLPFVSGGSVVVFDGDPVVALGRAAADDRVTFLKATPSQLEVFVRMVDSPRPLRVIVVGGEAFRRPVAESIVAACEPGVAVFNEYGPTEAVVGCMIHEWNPQVDVGVDVPIGAASRGSELTVLDSTGHPTPAGAWGELWVRRGGMATGYLNRPDLTAERFLASPRHGEEPIPGQLGGDERGPWYRTGDRVRLERPGVLTYGGRSDDQMKVNGIRLEPAEVEAALVEHPNVANALVRLWTPDDRVSTARCVRCGLGTDVPGVELDDQEVCSVCRDYDRVAPQTDAWFRTETDLDSELARARERSTGDYDCLHLLSGGKDSSYALYQLVERGWRVHALTLDNGFISEGAKQNVRNSIEALGITHEFATTESMNEIFRDSLDRYSNVCQGCYKTIYTLAVARAEQLGIPVVVTGLSRGQFFETRLIPAQFESGRFDPDAIDATVLAARKVYHGQRDAVTDLLPEQSVFDDADVFERVEFLDFYRYLDVDLTELYRYLEDNAPWVRPADTGRSTNCLVNVAGIQVHHAERGYHNYAEPYAWDVRLGHKTRAEALAELDDRLDGGTENPEVVPMLAEIGYRAKRIEVLTAWYQSVDGTELDPDELRRWVRSRVADHAVPAAFVRIDEVPLAASAKADASALPAPTRLHRRSDEMVLPATEIERTLCGIWAEVLRLEAVGATDDFFDLGGDSLAALEVVATVADTMGVDLDDTAVFEARTVRDLAASMERDPFDTPEHATAEIPSLDDGERPLSAGEEAMLFEYRQAPASARYNISRRYSLPADVDLDRLSGAIHHVVGVHQPLHTAFDVERTVLRIERAVRIDHHEVTSAESFRSELVPDAVQEPFDLDHGPLVRATTGRHDEGVDVLISMHHICIDVGAFDAFWQQVTDTYDGRDVTLPNTTYAAHGAWQRSHVHPDHAAFWARERAAATASGDVVSLAVAAPVPAEPDNYLSQALAIAASDLRQGTGRTPFVASVVAAAAAVDRFSSGGDADAGSFVELGVTASVKDHPDTADLVGYFLNVVPMRIGLGHDATFAEVAAQADTVVADAVRHRTYPFASIVRDARAAGHAVPQMSAMLAYNRLAPARVDGHDVEPEIVSAGSAVTDLSLFVYEHGENLSVGIEYSGRVLSAIDAQRVLDSFASLLEASVSDPDGVLALVGAGDASELVGPPPPDHTPTVLHDVLAHVDTIPDAVAVIDSTGGSLTYGELAARVLDVAERLAPLVGEAASPVLVGVCVERGVEVAVAMLGVQLAGAAYVPIDPASPTDRIQTIASSVELAAVVADHANADRIDGVDTVYVRVDDIESEADTADRFRTLATGVDASEPAYVIFTSGSTGVPRGVVVTHAELAASNAARAAVYGDAPGRFLLTSSIGFDSSIVGLVWSLTSGGTIVIPNDDDVHDVDALVRIIESSSVTHLLMVPTLYRAVLQRGDDRIGSLRVAIVAGEACTPDVVDRHRESLPGTALVNEYGPTEATVWCSFHRLDTEPAGAPVPIGTPIAGVTLRVADPAGRPVPVGVAGELLVAGPTVTAGYLGHPERTASAFVAVDGRRWYRTGDLVRLRSAGASVLDFLGRVDDQLNVGGVRVEPAEIEAVLRRVSGLDDVVVVADSGPRPRLVAHVAAVGSVDEAAIRRSLAVELPASHVPSRVVVRASLPQTSHGKLDRRAAAALDVDAGPPASAAAATTTSLVDQIVTVWRDALGRPEVDARTDYFEIGGNSLAAVEIVTAVEAVVGSSVPIAVLLDGRSPAGMASLLGGSDHSSSTNGEVAPARLVTMQTGGVDGPIVVLTPAWDDVFGYRALVDALPDEVRVLGVSAADVAPEDIVTTIDALSGHFEQTLLDGAPEVRERPITLVGWSTAGIVSYDLAGRLRARGVEIERIVMVDTFFPGAEQHLWSNRWWMYKSLVTPSAIADELGRFATRRSRAIARKVGTRLLRYAGVEVPKLPERASVGGVPMEAFTYRPEPSDVDIVLYAADKTNPERTFRRWQEIATVEVVLIDGRHRGFNSVMAADRVEQITDDLSRRLAADS